MLLIEPKKYRMIYMSQLPLDNFYAVCHNEEFPDRFPRSRDMYPDLGLCIKSFLSPETSILFANKLIPELDHYKKNSLVKAIYFIKILLQRMPEDAQFTWFNWLKKQTKIKASENDHLTFFYADADALLHPCNDASALNLGLLKGLERSKIKQLIEFGVA